MTAAGSGRAANGQQTLELAPFNYAASTRPEAKKPHGMGDPEPTIVHVAILAVACHAGGRGFEFRRSHKVPANRHLLSAA
jgi:hypothetical protein